MSFNKLVKICQETDTESHTIHLSEGRSYQHTPNAQDYNHSRVATAAPLAINPVPSGSGNGHSPHPDAMDLSAAATRGKISEEERASRLHEGCCLYCRGVRHMACHCPNKSKNPFRAASAHIEGNTNAPANASPNAFANPNTFATPPNSGGGGNWGGNWGAGGTGGKGQSGNA